MKKENIMFAVIGLLVGSIVGFMFANSVNRTAITQAPVTSTNTGTSGSASSGNPALPADHPPIGTSSGDANSGPEGAAAIAKVSAAIEKAKSEPENFDAQMTAGDLYYQIQRFDDAVKFYEAANKLKPADVEPMIKAGNSYFDSDKYELAEKWYLQALQKDPKNVSVRTDLGLTFFLREPRDIDRAIKEYEASLQMDPKHEITLQNLALAYKEKNDTANLNATLERLRKVNPDNPALKSANRSL